VSRGGDAGEDQRGDAVARQHVFSRRENVRGSELRTRADQLRLNAICPYFTMFPLHFPYGLLRHAVSGERVLDPFCGRGTTIFAARLRGLASVGIDTNPVAAAIAEAKLVGVRPTDVVKRCKHFLDRHSEPRDVPAGRFWQLAYHPRTLGEICSIREGLIDQGNGAIDVALRAVMLGILHGPVNKGEPAYLSNQMPRTYATKPAPAVRYWVKKRLQPALINALSVVSRRAKSMFGVLPPKTSGKIILGDSRTADLGKLDRFNWVITSPPYPGMRTYVPDQWLRNWFLGGAPDVQYRAQLQIGSEDSEKIANELAKVWTNIARFCRPMARLVVRFGTLPSAQSEDAVLVLTRSLARADAGWRVTTIKSAGTACLGKRQATQFSVSPSSPYREFDLYARLGA
jgi:hypothetical protein